MRNDAITEPGLLGTAYTSEPADRGVLAQRMICPPFSVLDTRQGWWQERRRAWLALGIESELGRDAVSYQGQSSLNDLQGGKGMKTGVSIFDAVLCEIAYTWFCPPGGIVLDPFCGGSVRGIVAAATGRKYWGCDLRAAQVDSNNQQAKQIGPDKLKHRPRWAVGDSAVVVPQKAPTADMVFSCPPYGTLEKYSDDPADISNRDSVAAFAADYTTIIKAAANKLQPDSFAVFVVGNYRDKKKNLVDFVGMTVSAFEEAGLSYYNEAVLLNSAGTAPVRVNTNFDRGNRKLVKTHQNVLVFLKGDAAKAAADLPNLSKGTDV